MVPFLSRPGSERRYIRAVHVTGRNLFLSYLTSAFSCAVALVSRTPCALKTTVSGKMKTLTKLLSKYYRNENRVLVFSHSTVTLGLIEQHLRSEGMTHLRLDGSTATGARQRLVDQFQNDARIFCFLISTKAGGLGLVRSQSRIPCLLVCVLVLTYCNVKSCRT